MNALAAEPQALGVETIWASTGYESHVQCLRPHERYPSCELMLGSRQSLSLLTALDMACIGSTASAQGEVAVRDSARLLRAENSLRLIRPGVWPEGQLVALAPVRGGSLVLHGSDADLGRTSTPWKDPVPDVFRA